MALRNYQNRMSSQNDGNGGFETVAFGFDKTT